MKNKKLMAFWGIIVLFYLAANFAHPVTPTLIVERGLDSSVFGTALAAMQTTMFLFSPFWGQLCNYMPTKKIILLSTIGYAIGQAIFGAAQNEMMVFAGRIFAGCFTGGCFTAFSNYVINTSDPGHMGTQNDGYTIRKFATESNVTMFTSLDTVRVLLDVLEETTLCISTIDA